MGWGNGNIGGGSGGLNFSVKSYGEGVKIPSYANENTIAVITNTEISGWQFSSTEPSDVDEGFLWIYSGASGSVRFNALKKNSIVIFPGSTLQFVGGSWSYVDAYIFQDGKWVQFAMAWNGYYFENGDQHKGVTGGWTSEGYSYYAYSMIGGTVGSSINTATSGSNTASMVGTASPIDLTDVDKIHIKVESVYGFSFFVVMATKSLGASDLRTSLSSGEITVDVSGLSGNYYLAIASVGSATYATANAIVNAVWRDNSTSGGSESGVALLSIDNDASDNFVQMVADGVTYGVNNVTVNQSPTEETYDFTVM